MCGICAKTIHKIAWKGIIEKWYDTSIVNWSVYEDKISGNVALLAQPY